MTNTGATQTLRMTICAPIPVGHEVVVQYWARDLGVFGTNLKVEESEPSVLDRSTGVTYGMEWQGMSFFGFAPGEGEKTWKSRPARRIEGVVRACAVFTNNGTQSPHVTTVLTIETREGYR